MQFRRLRWHSRRRQEALFTRLEQELKRWLDAWSVEPACLDLQAVNADTYKPVSPLKWMRVNSDKGALYFGAPTEHLEKLGGLLAKAAAGDILHLGRRVGDRALKALFSQWIGVPVLDLDIQDGMPPLNDIFIPRLGHTVFALKGSGFLAYVILDADLTDSLVPGEVLKHEALAQRDISSINAEIELQVSLDLGETTLADTIGLQVGDVLVSNASIHSAFHLTHPDARRLANVRLVRKGLQRAVQVDTP
ncbi:MAG: hypothetical protein ACREO1_06755 [Arenimonas sp.]